MFYKARPNVIKHKRKVTGGSFNKTYPLKKVNYDVKI